MFAINNEEQFIKLFFDLHILDRAHCDQDERLSLLPVVDKIMKIAEKAFFHGILAVEEDVNEIQSPYFRAGLTMMVDGIDPFEQYFHLLNSALSSDYQGKYLLEYLLYLTGLCLMQIETHPQITHQALASLLNIDYLMTIADIATAENYMHFTAEPNVDHKSEISDSMQEDFSCLTDLEPLDLRIVLRYLSFKEIAFVFQAADNNVQEYLKKCISDDSYRLFKGYRTNASSIDLTVYRIQALVCWLWANRRIKLKKHPENINEIVRILFYHRCNDMLQTPSFDFVINEEILKRSSCSNKERLALTPTVETIVDLSEFAQNNDLLSLSDKISCIEPVILRIGMKHVIDCTEPALIMSILMNASVSDGAKGAEFLQRLICITGIFCILNGYDTSLTSNILHSFLGPEQLCASIDGEGQLEA